MLLTSSGSRGRVAAGACVVFIGLLLSYEGRSLDEARADTRTGRDLLRVAASRGLRPPGDFGWFGTPVVHVMTDDGR